MIYSVRFRFDDVEDGVTLTCCPTTSSSAEQNLNLGELWFAKLEMLKDMIAEAKLPVSIASVDGAEDVYTVTGDQLVILGYPLDPETR